MTKAAIPRIALLYLSMLRAAGLNGYAMRVVDRNRSLFAPGYMYFDQLDDTDCPA
jgi:hypothetical protein